MLVTLSGIVTFVKLVHQANAELPMVVTPSEITTFLIDELFEYHGTSLEDVQFVIAPLPSVIARPATDATDSPAKIPCPSVLAKLKNVSKWALK